VRENSGENREAQSRFILLGPQNDNIQGAERKRDRGVDRERRQEREKDERESEKERVRSMKRKKDGETTCSQVWHTSGG
jgi:hypothetical protein